jgi:excisionase family DNA binding protein
MISFNQTDSPQVLNNCISVQVAARYSGYSLQYLRRLLRNSKLEGIKIGQLWLIDKRALDIYIEQANDAIDQRFGPKL